MSYAQAMKAAGATISAYESFGSYQGDWWALVTYEGKTGYVTGSYGSCSGCDAFEAEFGWEDRDDPEKLSAFGKGYLEQMMSFEEAIKEASRNIEWDYEAEKIVQWLNEVESMRGK